MSASQTPVLTPHSSLNTPSQLSSTNTPTVAVNRMYAGHLPESDFSRSSGEMCWMMIIIGTLATAGHRAHRGKAVCAFPLCALCGLRWPILLSQCRMFRFNVRQLAVPEPMDAVCQHIHY